MQYQVSSSTSFCIPNIPTLQTGGWFEWLMLAVIVPGLFYVRASTVSFLSNCVAAPINGIGVLLPRELFIRLDGRTGSLP